MPFGGVIKVVAGWDEYPCPVGANDEEEGVLGVVGGSALVFVLAVGGCVSWLTTAAPFLMAALMAINNYVSTINIHKQQYQ